jgi:hypothetical protein
MPSGMAGTAAGGQPGTTPAAAARETFTAKAERALREGNERLAFDYLYASALAEDATDVLDKYTWVTAFKRPMLAVRWGIGVELTVSPKSYEGNYYPVGTTQTLPERGSTRGRRGAGQTAQHGGGAGPGRGGSNSMPPANAGMPAGSGMMPGGSGMGGYPGAQGAANQPGAEILTKAVGEVHTEFEKRLREKIRSGAYGEILGQLASAPVRPTGGNGYPGGMPGSNFPGAGYGSMPGAGMPGMPGSGMPSTQGPGMPGMPSSGMPSTQGPGMPGMPNSGMPSTQGPGMPGMPNSGMPSTQGPGMPGSPPAGSAAPGSAAPGMAAPGGAAANSVPRIMLGGGGGSPAGGRGPAGAATGMMPPQGSGGGMAPPLGSGGGMMPGPGGIGGQGNAAAGPASLMTGVRLLGEDSTKDLLKKAADEGVDVLVVYEVKVTENLKTKLITNDTRIAVYNVATGEQIERSKVLNNFEVQRFRAEEDKDEEDPVTVCLDRLFTALDGSPEHGGLKATDLPAGTKPEHVEGRVAAILADRNMPRLAALAEIKFFYHRGLVSDGLLEKSFQKLLGDAEGAKLASGKEEERIEVASTLIPRED